MVAGRQQWLKMPRLDAYRQQASHLNVPAGLEPGRRALSQSHSSCDPLVGTRTGCAHCVGGLCIVAAALGLGTARTLLGVWVAALGQHGNRLAFDRLAQRGFLDAYTPGHHRRAKPLGECGRVWAGMGGWPTGFAAANHLSTILYERTVIV